jgi:membrane-associated phospholipid phosphatase
MHRFHQTISILLHPLVMPTIGVILYFLIVPNTYESNQKLALLGLIFVTTYLVPTLFLILFKKLKLINSFKAQIIEERKIPVALMIVVFYVLANTIASKTNIIAISLLFYATSAALTFIYLCFAYQLKISIHLLSLGISTGFFILLGFLYNYSFPFVIMGNIVVAGLVANARLYLNAHTPKEVYLGYFIGFIAPFPVYYFL